MKANREPELVVIQRLAEHLASGRNERVTTAHLMAAVAAHPGVAADLLRERRLGSEDLLRAARSTVDDDKDPLGLALQRAGEVAQRMRATEPSSAHLLIALLGNRRTAAYRALDQCGVNVNRLRLAAMNLILGLVGRRPVENRRPVRASVAQHGAIVPGPLAAAPRPTAQLKPQVIKPTTHISRRARVVSPEDLRQHKRVGVAQRSVAPQRVAARLGVGPAHRGRGFELGKKKFPLLSRLGRNLTLAAANGELDEVVCRDAEVDRVLDVLGKRFANNACLVGPSGVGKTRIVHALAQRLASGGRRKQELEGEAEPASDERCPIIIEVSAGQLVMGTQVRGGIGQRMDALRRELAAAEGRVVLFFDEIHQLFTGDGGDELSSEFKVAVGRGEMPCIGATTREEYRRSIEADPALARRFSLIEIEEPSREDAYLILQALMPRFEAHHQLRYSDEALARAVAWASQYIKTRALPDKAVALLDLCGARARRRGEQEVTPLQVAELVSEMVDVPIERLLESDGERMLRLETVLGERVVGHSECLRTIARSIRRNAAGLGARRPIGTFLLLGPTGVGKTETAKALAEALFFSEDAMTRIDLSEYGEAHSVARLIGAPPGYIGHEAGGQLTEAVRRKPYQVLLFDELEKAHRDVLQSFLALFDEGRMTDGRGQTVDFTNTIILLTSNLGAAEVDTAPRRVGFHSEEASENADYRRRLIKYVRSALAPELFNRLDDVLVYSALSTSEIRDIAARMLARLSRRLREGKSLEVEFCPSVIDLLLADGGFDLKLGARPMQRSLARCVETPLAELVLRGELAPGEPIRCHAREGRVAFERSSS